MGEYGVLKWVSTEYQVDTECLGWVSTGYLVINWSEHGVQMIIQHGVPLYAPGLKPDREIRKAYYTSGRIHQSPVRHSTTPCWWVSTEHLVW